MGKWRTETGTEASGVHRWPVVGHPNVVDTWFHDQFHDADNRGQPFVFDADALRDHIEDWQGKHKGADLPPERFGISQLASDYIDEEEKSVAHGTWETLRRVEKAFRAYEDATGDTITVDNFTTPDRARETVENLSEWLRTEYILLPSNGTTVVGWSANTLSRGLGHLATIIKWAAKRENIYVHTDRSVFTGLKSGVEKKDSISLSAADVDKLENVSIPEGTLRDQVREMFVLACYHGQRFSDWRSIKPGLMTREAEQKLQDQYHLIYSSEIPDSSVSFTTASGKHMATTIFVE